MPFGQKMIRVFWNLEHPIPFAPAIKGEGGEKRFILFNLAKRSLLESQSCCAGKFPDTLLEGSFILQIKGYLGKLLHSEVKGASTLLAQ